MRREVVVTGLGVVSPIGIGVARFEHALLAGRSNVAEVTLFDTSGYRVRIGQTVCDELRGSGDPAVAFALRAAGEAIASAGLDAGALARCGLAVATTAAGWTAGQQLFASYEAADDTRFAERVGQPAALFKESVVHGVASAYGLGGACALLSAACAAASSAIAWAGGRIRDGSVDVMLAGATDALTEVVFAGFHSMRLLASDACRPFDADRNGLVLSEGAAFLVLESEEHAKARGAEVLARLGGWSLSCDAAHPTTPDSEGMLRAMSGAVDDAGLRPEDVDQVSAHGTGSPANDAAEAKAIAALLGERTAEVPVGAIKGTLGHTEGAAGAFGALAAVLSLRHDRLPPAAGHSRRDDALPALRIVTGAAERYEGRNVLVNASGFGGANASLVFQKPGSGRSSTQRRGEAQTSRAVVTGLVVLSKRDGTLPEAGVPRFWPGSRSLPLDRVSGLVMLAGERLLGPQEAAGVDAEAAVVLGTTYGSQACHERIWRALARGGPRAVDPNDFAVSTFNAPGAALASAYGFGGANLVFLGASGGSAALDEAARLIAAGRAVRVVAGAYEEVTPYFARVLAAQGEPDVSKAVALMMLEDEVAARERGATALATILGQTSRAPAGHWPNETELTATIRLAMERAGSGPGDIGAVVIDPHINTRDAQLAAVDSVFGPGLTMVDVGPRYGNCLAASAPLAIHASIEAAHAGSWPEGMVLRGEPSCAADKPVLILSCGLMSGCAALLVQPHGRP